MDIKKIIKARVESASNELKLLTHDGLVTGSYTGYLLRGEIDAYNDCLNLIEQSEKPMEAKTIVESDGTEDGCVEYLNCPKCGKEIWYDGTGLDKPDYCSNCGQRLNWLVKEEKK